MDIRTAASRRCFSGVESLHSSGVCRGDSQKVLAAIRFCKIHVMLARNVNSRTGIPVWPRATVLACASSFARDWRVVLYFCYSLKTLNGEMQ